MRAGVVLLLSLLLSGLNALLPNSCLAEDERNPLARWKSTPVAFRHYEGKRYLTFRLGTRVYGSASAASPILHDLPKFRLVYAERTGERGWLRVFGAGSDRYSPRHFRDTSWDDPRSLISANGAMDHGKYYPLFGYVKASELLDMDVEDPPFPKRKLVPVPNAWADYGSRDPRFFAVDPGIHPFDAIVQVFQNGLARVSNRCAGSFYVNTSTVLTVGHCLGENMIVRIARGKTTETIKVVEKKKVEYDSKLDVDWTLLTLEHPPETRVGVLQPFGGSIFESQGMVRTLQIGYAGDLATYAKRPTGFYAPNVSLCELQLSETLRKSSYKDRYVVLNEHFCPMSQGDSGGPVLIWNKGTARFEVIGIQSSGAREFDQRDLTDLLEEGTTTALVKFISDVAISKKWISSPMDQLYSWTAPAGSSLPNWSAVQDAIFSRSFRADRDLTRRSTFDETMTASADPSRSDGLARMYDRSDDFDDVTLRGYDARLEEGTAENFEVPMLIKSLCLEKCKAEALDLGKRVTSTIGDVLRPTEKDIFFGIKVGDEDRLDSRLARDQGSKARFYVIGGDLFAVRSTDMKIRWIFRNVMNLVEGGHPEYHQLGCGLCEAESGWKEKSSIPPQDALRMRDFGAPTPASIPGGSTIFPRDAYALIRADAPIVLAGLNDIVGLPSAHAALFAAPGGTFDDGTQKRLGEFLDKLSGGDKGRTILTYCHNAQCWLSYNVALRAIHLGYSDVRWMRQGIEGWREEGLPMGLVRDAAR